ncbi:MAG: LptF/LptG family permease [Pirellulaceae bacterium]|nr:LptF/LptG family permease [Planctomycetales bacterium]
MRALTRYAVREYVSTFVATLSGMTLFMMLLGVARHAVQQGLGLLPILRLLPYIIPDALRFSMPAAALLAACSAFGRMSSDNEVVALKSLGISPTALTTPVYVFALMASVFAVFVNDLCASWGRPGVNRVVVESIEQIAYGMLRTQHTYDSKRFSITVKHVEGKRLIRPIIVFRDGNGRTTLTLTAREAQLRRSMTSDALIVQITDGFVEAEGRGEIAFAGSTEREIPLGRDSESELGLSPSDFPLWQLPAARHDQREEIVAKRKAMATHAAYSLLSGNLASLAAESWHEHQRQLGAAEYRLNRLTTEPWRRWANGFSCFFFVIVGAPLAIRARNSDFVTTFFACFLPILLVYYPLMEYGVDRAKSGSFPPYSVWLGNAICLIVGWLLMKRVSRY